MSELPVELIITILELIYFQDDGLPNHSTLKNCSLVCPTWTEPAQQLLFRYGSLSCERRSFQQLRDIFETSPRGKFLAQSVRCIKLDVGNMISKQPRAYAAQHLIPILLMFPKLYELDVRCLGANTHTLIIDDLAGANASQLPHLRSLKLHAHGPGYALLFHFLSYWPSIRFLSFDIGRTGLPPPEKVPGIQLWQMKYRIPPRLETLQWLVPNHSLRVLGIKYETGGTESFIRQEGPYLRSLRLPTLSRWTHSVQIIPLCPNLKELDIDDLFMESWDSEIFSSIPAGLQHLRIRRVRCSWDEMREFIRRILRPCLRTISLPSYALDWQQIPCWKEFTKECLEMNVTIIYVPYEPEAEWDDPIVSDEFPRGKSVDNFRLMN